MTTTHDVVDQAHERSGRLGPADVQNVLFSRAGLGPRGYDESEVDFFLDRVQTELSRLIGEKVALRDEVAGLREQLASGPGDGTPRRDEASAQAVKVLSAAQQTADQYVADAESYTKRLAEEGRERYERTVEEGVARARSIVEEARAEADAVLAAAAAAAEEGVADSGRPGPVSSGEASDLTTAELEQQAAYLRTFGQVCRVQLRAYLEALLRDVELEWGRAHPGAVAAPAGAPASPGPSMIDLDHAADLDGDLSGRERQPARAVGPVQA